MFSCIPVLERIRFARTERPLRARLVTSLLGFLPVAAGLLIYFVRHRPRPSLRQWGLGLGALVGLSLLFVQLPEFLLKDPNSPYPFPDRGYYEQFADGNSQSNGSAAVVAHTVAVAFDCGGDCPGKSGTARILVDGANVAGAD